MNFFFKNTGKGRSEITVFTFKNIVEIADVQTQHVTMRHFVSLKIGNFHYQWSF